jgi:hypothetical protein
VAPDFLNLRKNQMSFMAGFLAMPLYKITCYSFKKKKITKKILHFFHSHHITADSMISSGNKKNNSRVHPRADFFQKAYFIVEGTSHSVTHECWFFNISLGGMGLESDRTDLKNAIIDVLYTINTQFRKDRLLIKYSIKGISKWRYGGQFLNDDDARSTLISHFIEKRLKRDA